MKKILFIAALALTASTFAAQAQAYCGCGMYGGGMYGPGYSTNTATPAEYQQFMAEVAGLRAELMTQQAELNALLAQPNPDESLVRSLTAGISEKRTTIMLRARELGLPPGAAYACFGPMGGRMGWHGRGY